MGWDTDLLGARFRNAPFQVASLSDQGGKTLVAHEYPYRAGGSIEDMGRLIRVVPIKAVFWGENYASELRRLTAALEQPGPGELIHPVFGSVMANVRSWRVDHNAERPNYAEVFFEAVVGALDEPFFQEVSSKGKAEQAAAVTARASKALLERSTTVCKGLMEAYATSPAAQGELVQKMDEVLRVYDPQELVIRAKSGFDPLTLITELFAAQRAVIASAAIYSGMERYVFWSDRLPKLDSDKGLEAFQLFSVYPARAKYWSKKWISGGGPGVYAKTPSIPAASTEVLASTEPLATNRDAEAGITTCFALSQTSFCAQEVSRILLEEVSAGSFAYTPMDIDAIVGALRMRAQDCLRAVRATFPQEHVYGASENLRDLAEQVQTLGRAVRDVQPEVSLYTASYQESLCLLAHRLYGDYRRARDLLRLNPQIQNPSSLQVGQELLIYVDKKASL